MEKGQQKGHPATWVPSLYLAEALPYAAVMLISVVMYKDLGLSDAQIALYTSWLGLPWVVKPIWSSIVDNLRTKRWWILTMQYLVGAALAMVAFTLQTAWWLQLSLAILMLVAFSSATHDISADGFYILALNNAQQSAFVGIRNTFYRVGMVLGQGGLVVLGGLLAKGSLGLPPMGISGSWMAVFLILGAVMLLLAAVHTFTLPKIEKEGRNTLSVSEQCREFAATLRAFAQKPHLWSALAFILLFRLPEGLLTKIVPIFMMRTPEEGGLGLSNEQFGVVYGTLGVVGLLLGGIVGGFLVAQFGLKRCLWPLVMCFTVPDVVYLVLCLIPTPSIYAVGTCVFLEQMGYGMGFAAYTLFLINFSRGERSTAIFSLCTAGQFLGGAILPGMVSGWISQSVGYATFFAIVLATCMVTFTVTATAHIREE